MDDAGGCFSALLLCAMLLFALFVARMDGKSAGYKQGYRRGFCEGRGGVEATVNDSIRCIRLPENVRTK